MICPSFNHRLSPSLRKGRRELLSPALLLQWEAWSTISGQEPVENSHPIFLFQNKLLHEPCKGRNTSLWWENPLFWDLVLKRVSRGLDIGRAYLFPQGRELPCYNLVQLNPLTLCLDFHNCSHVNNLAIKGTWETAFREGRRDLLIGWNQV